MIKDITINASAREGVGKGPTRRLRAQGMIPAAIYGEGGDALAIAVSAKEIASILRSGSKRRRTRQRDHQGLSNRSGQGPLAARGSAAVVDDHVDPRERLG